MKYALAFLVEPVFYNASPACSIIKFSLWLGLEDPEDWFVIEGQLLQRFVPGGCFSLQQAQCSAWFCGAEISNFWLGTSFCDQTILMPYHIFFKEMQPLSYGVLSVKFAVYCIIKLRPMLVVHSAPSYWLSQFNLLRWLLSLFWQEDVMWMCSGQAFQHHNGRKYLQRKHSNFS